MKDFRDLKVWEKGHLLTLGVCQATVDLPRSKPCGLKSQIRRSSSSIPAALCDVCGSDGGAEMARFVRIASGPASGLEHHLLLACDLDLLPDSEHDRLTRDVTEVKRMLASFIKKPKAEG